MEDGFSLDSDWAHRRLILEDMVHMWGTSGNELDLLYSVNIVGVRMFAMMIASELRIQ